MKRIGFVIPYFGKLPNYFDLFLRTCRDNPSIDFLIFSDKSINIDRISKNVKFHQMTFDSLKKIYRNKCELSICLDTPYKLCDFKPAIGYVYGEYLREYDWWGHIDIDTLLGDLRRFFTMKY